MNTGIHTRISDNLRISSAWREYGNGNFQTFAWETFLWEGEKIKEEFSTYKDANDVIELHKRIFEKESGRKK